MKRIDVQEVESLNWLFLRVIGQVFLGPGGSRAGIAAADLPGTWKRALYFLEIHGPSRMGDVARHVGLSLPAASAAVDRLVEAGLVKRVPDADDRRATRVGLSAAGRRRMAAMKRIHEERLENALRRLSPAKRSELKGCFQRIHELLSEIEATEDTPPA